MKVQQNRTNNTYTFKKRGGCRRTVVKASDLVINYIKYLYNANPLWQLKQIQYLVRSTFALTLSPSHIHGIIKKKLQLKRRRISHIAKQRASVRIQNWRKVFADYAQGLDPFKLVYFDESYFTFHDMLPKYAYVENAAIVKLPIQKVSRKRFSLLAAMSATAIMHWEVVDAAGGDTVNDEKVANFLRTLLPLVTSDTIIVMDNASIHHSPQVKSLVNQYPDQFLFTSAYSPDFNAIELLFGTTKALLKNYYSSPASLQFLVHKIMKETPSHIFAAFVHHTFQNYKKEAEQ